MKELNNSQMQNIEGGWPWEAVICDAYFLGMATAIGSATIVGGVVVGALAIGVCTVAISYANS